MSLLKKLTTDDSIANEKDVVSSGGPLESGLYNATVKLAYVTVAASEAVGLVVHLATETGREIRETLWMTSGKEKGGNNFYIDKDGEKQYLPGFVNANALSLLTVGKEVSELDTETKVVNVYSAAAKAEVPTKVEVPVDLLNKEILVGVIKEIVHKNVKDASGKYVPSGETREQNTIDKLFRASDKKTTTEIRAKADEASFYEVWNDKWEGKERDRTGGKAGQAAATGGSKAAPTTKKPTTSLFA